MPRVVIPLGIKTHDDIYRFVYSRDKGYNKDIKWL